MNPESSRAAQRPRPGTILCVLICAVLVIATGSPMQQNAKAEVNLTSEKPNILLVVADDQPLRTMETMPITRAWMGETGVRYPHAYATTPVCCPSRTTLMTGRYAHNHGVTTNGQQGVVNLDHDATIQRVLGDNGYRTAAFGKYLNAWDVYEPPPHFDEWAIIPKSAKAYFGGIWNTQGEVTRVGTYGTTYVGDRATDFIERTTEEPWFMYLAPPAPHPPFEPESRYLDLKVSKWNGDPSNFDRRTGDMPWYVQRANKSVAEGKQTRRQQLVTLRSLDDVMGDLRETLELTGELENTVVIYISDNGYLWGQHGLIKKFVPYVESVRIPAFISWPAGLPVGKDGRIVGTIDITPTILDAAGLAQDELPVDGRSLLDDSWSRREILIEAWKDSPYIPAWSGLISPRRSYVTYYEENNFIAEFKEYYDLRDDPFQMSNLLGDRDTSNDPKKRGELALRLFEARTCAGPGDCP